MFKRWLHTCKLNSLDKFKFETFRGILKIFKFVFQVWDSQYPVAIKYQHDMKTFRWRYTQFSQFNSTDTLLLVSGVHFGTPHTTSGEIAVFRVAREISIIKFLFYILFIFL